MTFDSLTFLCFLLVVLAGYGLLAGWRARKGLLLAASYLFYAAWNPPFVLLLLGSTLIDWHAAARMAAADSHRRRRFWLVVSLTLNLGLLAYFKYGGFVLAEFQALMAALGIAWQAPDMTFILPVGISFYTFQTLSYSIDVYRGRAGRCSSFLDYALYVSFFPQLVAGPIVRYSEFINQLAEKRRLTAAAFEQGAALLVFGLFLKVVLADSLFAPMVETGFDAAEPVSATVAWLSLLSFSGQIYCDFAGYSLCAIGVAGMFGFVLPINFNVPYAARGFRDFWRRWHISLSRWLRDYLYIPLGGNRHGTARTFVNLVITMGLGGLWHGAAWTFVLWGLLHGAYLVVEHGLDRVTAGAAWLRSRWLQPLWVATTFLGVSLAWVLFRAADPGTAIDLYSTLLGGLTAPDTDKPGPRGWLCIGGITAMLTVHAWLYRRRLTAVYACTPWWLRALVLAFCAALICLNPGAGRTFIYFQF